MLKVGSRAPAFSLRSDAGDRVALKDLKGKPVVLYFYPRDDTDGCTTEACEFRDRWSMLKATGAVLLGISPDGVVSHRKFRTKYKLPFPLLADEDHAVADAYGAWGEKSMFGHRYHGVLRRTFLIGATGRIVKIFEKVRPKGHAVEVLAALREAAR
jgi:thioredoxin-dependent peroxiredoxin